MSAAIIAPSPLSFCRRGASKIWGDTRKEEEEGLTNTVYRENNSETVGPVLPL